MKAIFLDVDGVLNYAGCPERTPHGFTGVDPGCVRLLHSIIDPTGAVIILTSTWQTCWKNDVPDADGKYLVDKLAEEGLKIRDMTGRYALEDRALGIYEYLEKHKDIADWIVIDDEVYPGFEQYGILPHLVKTSYWSGGLKGEHVFKALDMLG